MHLFSQVNVLADMELWGIGADMDACLRARHIITKKLTD
jgi:DNA polymerase theta